MQRNPVHDQQTAVAAALRPDAPRIAVLLPCYNEEAAIGQVVRDFRAALPQATVYVYDNASSDRTGEVALGRVEIAVLDLDVRLEDQGREVRAGGFEDHVPLGRHQRLALGADELALDRHAGIDVG